MRFSHDYINSLHQEGGKVFSFWALLLHDGFVYEWELTKYLLLKTVNTDGKQKNNLAGSWKTLFIPNLKVKLC